MYTGKVKNETKIVKVIRMDKSISLFLVGTRRLSVCRYSINRLRRGRRHTFIYTGSGAAASAAAAFKWNPMIVVDVQRTAARNVRATGAGAMAEGVVDGADRTRGAVRRVYRYACICTRAMGGAVRGPRLGMKSVFGPMEWVCLLRRGWAELR